MYQPEFTEAFPNCEQIMLDAFNSPDPVPAVLGLIQAYPSVQTVEEVVIAYRTAFHSAPTRAYHFAKALSDICESPDAPLIYDAHSISDLIDGQLSEFHNLSFTFVSQCRRNPESFDQGAKIYGPTNRYLINSLLSGFSFKYNLGDSPSQSGAVGDGLGGSRFSVSVEDDPSLCQLQVVGTCIQLLTSGSEIVAKKPSSIRPVEEMATKLRAQKAAGAVTDPEALKVLELAILHAESGFKEENDITNVWDLLFPTTV
ncbi:hypothetical protein CPB83DRAFT_880207 [Crepidotus variabilis]|uniref:Uncharacterized protein n=1 Tax=Crepidotus variabilis TaxID=179855 RepID=A0A9P6EQU5_9AGAR|nr:hypothetical protein CPB83DRAFT_880207 [Crepidotus variabilis]